MKSKVKLETIGNGGAKIKAPDFCPYKEEAGFVDGKYYYKIHPSICALCKKCEFLTEDISDGISDVDRSKIVKYLVEFNSKIANSISAQNLYLTKENRIPLMIIINFDTLSQCLQYVYNNDSKKIEETKNYILLHNYPICYILGCPVMFSNKLTKSPIQVVGEIQWK